MERRWVRRLGPGIAALGAMAAIASTTAGAPAPVWDPPGCAGPAAVATAPVGAWFRLDPILTDGEYVGQWLSLGTPDPGSGRRLELDRESFATGPTNGAVLVGVDDARASSLTLVDVANACAWPIGTSRDVIRNAIVHPSGDSIIESRVDRRSWGDLGIWRRRFDGTPAVRVLPPIGADDRFGPTWRTDLAWGDDGTTLVVGSCGEAACRYRLVMSGAATTAPTTIADPMLGALVGLAGDRLVTRQACRGLPCPIVSTGIHGAVSDVLADDAGLAVMARDERGRTVVVHETDAGGRGIGSMRPDGSDRQVLPAPPFGSRLVADAAWAAGAAEHPADALVFGPDGRVAPDAARSTLLRPLWSEAATPLDEVVR